MCGRSERKAAADSQSSRGGKPNSTKAIFRILALKSPYSFNALLQVRKQRGLQNTRDGVLRRRVEALEKQDYLMKVGKVKTRLGYDTPLYPLAPRAELAMTISKIDLDRFVEEADDNRIIGLLEALQIITGYHYRNSHSERIQIYTSFHINKAKMPLIC